MKVLSLFSGIGAFEKALKNMGIPVDLVAYCEIDKYASKSYSAIHGVSEENNLGDITKVDTSTLPKDIGLITYGFPCQDISTAGNMRGFEHDGKRTRSGLFFEALRIIEDTQPLFAICENVKNLTSKKFSKEFEIVLSSLENAGYNNYWQILDAKDFGIPQHRERVFIVSIRKDIDRGFEFPEKQELKINLIDLLERDSIDEKYYLTESSIKTYNREFGSKGKAQDVDGICDTLLSSMGTGGGNIPIIDEDAFITDMGNCFRIREATKKGYADAYIGDSVNLEQPNSKTRRGRVGYGIAQTLTTSCNQAVIEPEIYV